MDDESGYVKIPSVEVLLYDDTVDVEEKLDIIDLILYVNKDNLSEDEVNTLLDLKNKLQNMGLRSNG